MQPSGLHTPRPTPVFLPEAQFSQRKKTPFRAPRPPRSPAKSCPPVSRVFATPRNHDRPQIVSFKSERKEAISSPLYDEWSQKSYFEQCFVIIEKLGEGSFGEVFKVQSKEDGRLYAVKRSRQGFRGEWDRRQKLAEVEKHECLPPHPNCVQFHRAWEERRHLYIQTELCLMSLEEYADLHGQLPEYMVWGLLLDLVKGLKHLHDHRLCHLDIKPANIFVGQDGVTFKLGDFGLCVDIEQDFQEATEGDAKYVAPELLQGGFGKPADIFSLGISLLEVGCDLELPSCGENWHQLREGHLPETFTKDLSPDLVKILARMMHPDPQIRPTVDEIFSNTSMWKAHCKYTIHRPYHTLVSLVTKFCSMAYRGILTLLTLLMCLFPVPSRSTRQQEVDVHPAPEPSLDQDQDSFSDNDEELIQEFINQSSNSVSSHQDSSLNCSWIQNSPMKYPSPVYGGPPIPLSFGDSSTNSSFEETHHSRSHSLLDESPCSRHSPGSGRNSLRSSPRVSLDYSFGLHNSSFSSYTPNTKPSLVDEKRNKSLNIGPKNLMAAFGESPHSL